MILNPQDPKKNKSVELFCPSRDFIYIYIQGQAIQANPQLIYVQQSRYEQERQWRRRREQRRREQEYYSWLRAQQAYGNNYALATRGYTTSTTPYVPPLSSIPAIAPLPPSGYQYARPPVGAVAFSPPLIASRQANTSGSNEQLSQQADNPSAAGDVEQPKVQRSQEPLVGESLGAKRVSILGASLSSMQPSSSSFAHFILLWSSLVEANQLPQRDHGAILFGGV